MYGLLVLNYQNTNKEPEQLKDAYPTQRCCECSLMRCHVQGDRCEECARRMREQITPIVPKSADDYGSGCY